MGSNKGIIYFFISLLIVVALLSVVSGILSDSTKSDVERDNDSSSTIATCMDLDESTKYFMDCGSDSLSKILPLKSIVNTSHDLNNDDYETFRKTEKVDRGGILGFSALPKGGVVHDDSLAYDNIISTALYVNGTIAQINESWEATTRYINVDGNGTAPMFYRITTNGTGDVHCCNTSNCSTLIQLSDSLSDGTDTLTIPKSCQFGNINPAVRIWLNFTLGTYYNESSLFVLEKGNTGDFPYICAEKQDLDGVGVNTTYSCFQDNPDMNSSTKLILLIVLPVIISLGVIYWVRKKFSNK